jgi:hypothetical protein
MQGGDPGLLPRRTLSWVTPLAPAARAAPNPLTQPQLTFAGATKRF